MSFALKTYMTHMGICPREARPASVVEKSQEKDKWLPFFPKTKKVGGEVGKGGTLYSSADPPWLGGTLTRLSLFWGHRAAAARRRRRPQWRTRSGTPS